MVSFARGLFFPSGNLSNDSSSILTTSSSLSFEAKRRLETPYIDGVYHVIPLVVSHPEEEEEVNDAVIVFDSPSASEASRWRRRILVQEVDEEEEEEQLTRSLSQRGGPQPMFGLPLGGVAITPAASGGDALTSSVVALIAKQMG